MPLWCYVLHMEGQIEAEKNQGRSSKRPKRRQRLRGQTGSGFASNSRTCNVNAKARESFLTLLCSSFRGRGLEKAAAAASFEKLLTQISILLTAAATAAAVR